MKTFKNISILFEENPISRAYIEYFKRKNLLNIKIIYLKPKSILPKMILKILKFNQNNYYPKKFLKNRKIIDFIREVENCFSLEKNFLFSMYNFNSLNYFKNISFTNSEDINSQECLEFFGKIKENEFLNTGKQIFKNVFQTNKNFFHIHSGYLPKVRGADASIHSIQMYKKLGASLFKMDKKIDSGKILYRAEKDFHKILFDNYHLFEDKDLYRIWFSFVDPAIRVWLLDAAIKNEINTNSYLDIDYNNEISNYYSFYNTNELNQFFKSVFKKRI